MDGTLLASGEAYAAKGERSGWLEDIKSLFDSASRRFAENKGMSHALILIDINEPSVPSQEDLPEDVDLSVYTSETHAAFARLIMSACGKRDIVGSAGANRFIVVTSGFANRVELEKLISKIIYRIRIADFMGGVHASAEVGAAVLEGNRMSAAELYKAAELALFNVKSRSDDGYEIFDRRIDIERPEISSESFSRIQRALDYAFDAFSSDEESGVAAKDILARLGALYKLNRIFIVSSGSPDSVMLQWNDHNVPAAEGKECSAVLSKAKISEYNKSGYWADENSLYVGLFQGFALVGAVAFQRFDDAPMNGDTELLAELSTVAKMISVYVVKLLGSISARDELLYSRAALDENRIACYAVDCESYRVIYLNSYTEKTLPSVRLGKLCPQLITELFDKIKSGEEKNCDSNGVYHYDTYEKHMQKWLATAITCIRRINGEYVFLVMTTDMSELMDSAKTKDKLTGLLTYEGFEMEAEKLIYGDGSKYCLALFKVFDFRSINDEYGYEVGDEILKSVSEKIKLILNDRERAARSSESGFLGLFRCGNIKILTAKLDYLFKVVQDDIAKKHPEVSFAFVCGIYPIDRDSYKLSAAIDRANFVIKNASKKNYLASSIIEVYDFEMNKALEERRNIENNMVRALKNDEFETVYQPKVDLETGRIYGAEALIRWRKPDGTLIHPSVFVPIFEDNEFVLEMDQWVYRRVLSNMKSWAENGIELPVVSVNVSRLHLRDSKFPERFEKIVDNFGIPHRFVEVELTESTFVSNYERLIALMNDIRSKGFSISIDDFGTGYSTLNLISMLPADVLKLDGNFFMKSELTNKNKKVIESIIMLAKNLGLKVISEGVETDEQVKFLKENKCDAVQGFYYYKPMSEKHFRQLLEKQQGICS